MSGMRYTTLADKPAEVLAFTRVTREEFAALLPAFEDAFQAPAIAAPLADVPSASLFVTTAPSDVSSVPKSLLNRPSVRAARKNATR